MDRSLVLPGAKADVAHLYGRGLVGAWLCNEGAGTQMIDSSPYGYHGSLENMADPWQGSDDGWCLNFDGVDDYAEVISANTLTLQPKTGLTVSGWFLNLDSTQVSAGVFGDWNDENNWLLWIPDTAELFRFQLRVGAATVLLTASAGSFPEGTWTHVVATWGANIAGGATRMVINGIEFSGTTTPGPIDSNASLIRIGVGQFLNEFRGKARDLLMWDRGMTIAEAKGVRNLRFDDLFAF